MLGLAYGHNKTRACIAGHGHAYRYGISLNLPAAAKQAVSRFKGCLGAGHTACKGGRKGYFFISRALGGYARNHAAEPIPHRAVGVVVKGVHGGILKATVGLYAVPALPDGGCAKAYRVQP